MKTRRMVVAISSAVAVVLLAALYVLWQVRVEPRLLVSKTRFGNMMKISWGIMRFDTDAGRLPTNLAEVVAADLLPDRSTIYACPMKHHSLWVSERSYRDAEYDFSFATNEVLISIPRSVFEQPRFSFIPSGYRDLRVEQGLKATD